MHGFGKDQITLGSAPDNDIVLSGPGVAPRHARIVKRDGLLFFVDDGTGPSFANGVPIGAGQSVSYDFRTPFALGQSPLAAAHPTVIMMLLSPGHVAAPRGHVIVGREAHRVSWVIAHPAVSAQHATVMLDRVMVQDHGSTSGTWLLGQRIAANQPTVMDPNGSISFGPVTMPVSLIIQLAQASQAGLSGPVGPVAAHAPSGSPVAHAPVPVAIAPLAPSPALASALPPPGAEPPRKHRTIIGELSLEQLASSAIAIGRTPDNQIVVPHAQVSSRHAQILRQGNELFLEDRGSANGTFVRGQRIAPGQRVRVEHGEKVYIGPMPLLIQVAGKHVNVIVEDQVSWAGKPLYDIEAWDLLLEVPDRDQPGAMKTLLDHVSFKALPGDMIALMGPSGAGKTTLLLTLNGYLPPTSGQVRINGEDLYLIYDALRGSIGYVPQDDIVHPELTVFEAVRYSAQFRLPPDYSDA